MAEDPQTPIDRATSRANRPILERLAANAGAGLENDVLTEVEVLLTDAATHPAGLYGLALIALQHKKTLPAFQAILRAHNLDTFEVVYAEVLALLYATAGNLSSAAYFAKLSVSLGFDASVQPLLPPSLPSFARALQIIKEVPYQRQAEKLAAARLYAKAIEHYELHLAFFPDQSDAIRALGQCLLKNGQPAQALAYLADRNGDPVATAADLSLRGQAYAALGQPAIAEEYHLEALGLEPENISYATARLADALFDPKYDETALITLARDWGNRLPAVDSSESQPKTDVLTGRRIRVGYLAATTGDPRDLEVLATVAASSDPQRFEIYLYGHRSIDDPANALLRGCHDEWRDVSECDPATLAAIIQGDGIDILIDIGGYAAPLHLAALAYRPAPFQISWLGNPVTLGLPQIDVELTAEDSAAATTQTPRRVALPCGLYCYDYFGRPAVRTGLCAKTVTFGADLALAQLHPDVLAAWAAILNQVPGSVLVLRDRLFVEGGLVDSLIELFTAHGIVDRIDVVKADPTGFYRQIDLLLTPFVAPHPHDAVAALMAGVPVVALHGAGRHRRQISGVLRHAGLAGLVAGDVADYIRLAVRLATEPQALESAITAVADSLTSAAVFDPSRFGADFDSVLLGIVGVSDTNGL